MVTDFADEAHDLRRLNEELKRKLKRAQWWAKWWKRSAMGWRRLAHSAVRCAKQNVPVSEWELAPGPLPGDIVLVPKRTG